MIDLKNRCMFEECGQAGIIIQTIKEIARECGAPEEGIARDNRTLILFGLLIEKALIDAYMKGHLETLTAIAEQEKIERESRGAL